MVTGLLLPATALLLAGVQKVRESATGTARWHPVLVGSVLRSRAALVFLVAGVADVSVAGGLILASRWAVWAATLAIAGYSVLGWRLPKDAGAGCQCFFVGLGDASTRAGLVVRNAGLAAPVLVSLATGPSSPGEFGVVEAAAIIGLALAVGVVTVGG